MTKRVFVLLSLLFFCFTLSAKEFVISYQTLTSGKLFHIENYDGKKIAKITRERENGSVFYQFHRLDDLLLARGITEKYFSDTIVRVTDPEGNRIGSFAAEIHSVYPTVYRVYNSSDYLIAKGYMNWVGSSFSLVDPTKPKTVYATFFRPRFKLFKDNWHFEIHQEGVIDFRILGLIGVFQKACDLNFEMLETARHP